MGADGGGQEKIKTAFCRLADGDGVRRDGEKIVLRPFEAVALERAAGSK